MIFINLSDNFKFFVTINNDNGDTLSMSINFDTVQEAWNNILEISKNFDRYDCVVTDNSHAPFTQYYFDTENNIKKSK